MNLSKWKYRAAMKEYGGPIERISQREIDFFGSTAYEAYAYLDLKKVRFPFAPNLLYGNAHGAGTSFDKKESVHRAISEALERWAWISSLESFRNEGRYEKLGYSQDSSTDGFAAYPGVFPGSPRQNAGYEAWERWAISHWWEEKLNQSEVSEAVSGVQMIEIESPHPNCKTTIVWKDLEQFRAYGFSANRSLKSAVEKSLVELNRNIRVLEFYLTKNGAGEQPSSANERRLIYFASEEGKRRFDNRIQRSIRNPIQKARLIVDSPVLGEWSKYTHVWRCLYDCSLLDSSRRDINVLDYFCF